MKSKPFFSLALYLRCHRWVCNDILNVGQKAHVQHTVRFVEHQEPRSIEVDPPAATEIHQSARRSHQNVKGPVHGLGLVPGRRSTVNPVDEDIRVYGELACLLVDLQ